MKNLLFLAIFFILTTLFVGCEKGEVSPKVDENGLTKEITDLVPQYILDEMKELGMPINGGANPPIIEETYFATPFILKSSNRPGDTPGFQFLDYKVIFSSQNNDDLTIMVDYESGPESGSGIGSFIVGEGCEFSVFVEINSVYSGGTTAKFIHVISGSLVNKGIENLYLANFMINNNGNPQGVWIENGEGRVIYDQDGFSEKLGGESKWYTKLPDCPCEYSEDINGREEMCGEWINCGSASQEYHYGATFEIRWVPNESGEPGQQCTYDAGRNLITSGIAAGSPDKDSPDICGWGDILTGQGFPDIEHYFDDVKTWGELPCYEYLNEWRPNNGNNCGVNPISDIEHMKKMVGEMTCEKITLIIKSAKDSPNLMIDGDLRNYIIGDITISLTEAQLISKLQNWKALKSCSMFPNDELCLLIDQAISNLQ
ncbi:MAG: hypothetical protein SF052_03200 [Bacteroidia bacterium]|nr:hypothetical protein [Bacteroidia bacterium]